MQLVGDSTDRQAQALKHAGTTMTIACPNCGARYREASTYYPSAAVVGGYTDGRIEAVPKTRTTLIFYCSDCQ